MLVAVATTVVAMGLCLTGSLTALAETIVLLLLIVSISTNIPVVVSRRDVVKYRHFRAPTGFLSSLFWAAWRFSRSRAGLRAAALLAVGMVRYGVSRRAGRKNSFSSGV